MKFLETPTAFVLSVMIAILAFGVGLTSPIWFLFDGKSPVEAMQAGTPIVIMTMVGMVVMVALGFLAQRLRKPVARQDEAPIEDEAVDRRKHLIVHVVTMLMFLVPFATIVLGILLKQVIDADARGPF